MTKLFLEKDVILKRLDGIEEELSEMQKLAQIPFEEFSIGVGFKLGQYHLHRALEGAFHIAGHILSRLPGGQATEYKELARKLGEFKILDAVFANTKLVEMAKYRNRLVHFYAEIKPEELYQILKNDLQDIETFLAGVKKVLEKPETFGLKVES